MLIETELNFIWPYIRMAIIKKTDTHKGVVGKA